MANSNLCGFAPSQHLLTLEGCENERVLFPTASGRWSLCTFSAKKVIILENTWYEYSSCIVPRDFGPPLQLELVSRAGGTPVLAGSYLLPHDGPRASQQTWWQRWKPIPATCLLLEQGEIGEVTMGMCGVELNGMLMDMKLPWSEHPNQMDILPITEDIENWIDLF